MHRRTFFMPQSVFRRPFHFRFSAAIFKPHYWFGLMKQILNIINQVFEVEKKLAAQNITLVQRHLDRIKAEIGEMGYQFHSPLKEKWDETRTDCEANIVGALKSKMTITDVIKPAVYSTEEGTKKIVQKAIVVVE